MKYFNEKMGLTIYDFDLGDESGSFQILESGWVKIFDYYHLTYNPLNSKLDNFSLIKPHIKQITGSRIFRLTNSVALGNTRNDFAESSLSIFFKMIGIIKEDISSIYTSSGQYYENSIRNSVNNQYDVLKWQTFGLFPDEKHHLQPMYVANQLISENDPEFTKANGGNIFNLTNSIIKYNNKTYQIDLSLFGGMPDGYPIFKQENYFDLIEVKTKSFAKLENNVLLDAFGNKNYEPMVAECIREYLEVTSLDGKLLGYKYLNQYVASDKFEINWVDKDLVDKHVKTVLLKGYFPIMKLDEQGDPLISLEKQEKQFKDDGSFYVNDASYYAQASLYSVLTYFTNHTKNAKNEYVLTQEIFNNLKVLFVMGIIKPMHYIQETINRQKQVFTWVDANKQPIRAINDEERINLFKISEVYEELYYVKDFIVQNEVSKYASLAHKTAGQLNILDLMATANDMYLDFFQEHKPFKLALKSDKDFIKGLKTYFSEHKNNEA